jgi:EAL domain-containing protein (putative c-di-GMP-specific phosphodiesterase class I)
MSLIRALDRAGSRKQKVVRDLVQMVLATGSIPLAEGVETKDELKACVNMGIQLIQGYFTGRPILVEDM